MVEPRETVETVTFIDNYCAAYEHLFATARSYEAFKFLHLGMISEIPRKSLPAYAFGGAKLYAKAVGLPNDQVLHHFLTESPWEIASLRNQRLSLILQQLQGRSIVLVIDDTGDRKKGKTTDYVARQYIGNLGKIDNGIVSVNAYGVLAGMTFPLLFKIFKPKGRLKAQDTYKTKLQLAQEIIQELQAWGFKFELVLADSLYGECHPFISVLNQFELKFIVAIRRAPKCALLAHLGHRGVDASKSASQVHSLESLRASLLQWQKRSALLAGSYLRQATDAALLEHHD